jgi:hypothetical protein
MNFTLVNHVDRDKLKFVAGSKLEMEQIFYAFSSDSLVVLDEAYTEKIVVLPKSR